MGKSNVVASVRAARVATIGLLAGTLIISGASLAFAQGATSSGATAAATEGDASSTTSAPDTGAQQTSEAPLADGQPSYPPAPAHPSAPEQVSTPEQPAPPAEPAPAPAPVESAPQAQVETAPAEQPEQQPSEDAATQPEQRKAGSVEVPALRWRTIDADGAVVAGTTVTLQGPRDAAVEDLGGDEQWADAAATAVVDNIGAADYAGLDLDPAPGIFRIEQFADEETAKSDPATVPTPVTVDGDYRVRTVEAEGYFVADAAEWTALAVLTDAASEAQDVTLAAPVSAPREFAPQAEIMPFADNSHADIVVRKRVFAEPSNLNGPVSSNIGTDAGSTVGTVFRLYANNGNDTVGAPTGYTCTVTSGGECTITVDAVNNGGANRNKRFWVVEEAPVAGSPAALNTYINSRLYVGSYTGPQDIRSLVGLTKQMTSNQTTYMPMTTNVSTGSGYTNISSGELPNTNATTGEAGSFGATVGSYKNPTISAKCEATPLRIGIVIDQSASIQNNQWTTFRNALVQGSNSVLRQLRDANAAVSILGFGSNVSGSNGWHYGASGPTALPTNNTALQNLIPTSRPGGSSNATNWDAALSTMQTANGSHDYDMILFVTDGAPNYILNGSEPSGTAVTLRSLEAPMYAANAIKAAGTRLVTVGVGAGASGNLVAQNLRAVSGETAGSDYLQGDWDALQQILSDIVTAATCQVPVDVSKTQLNADGSTTTLAADWQFTAGLQAGTTNGVTLTGNATQTTGNGDTGKARWTIKFTQPAGQSAVLKLSETQKPGWVLQSVACTLDAQPITTTIGQDGVSIVVNGLHPSAGALSCVYTNKEAAPASLVVDKVWKIDGETFAQGDQPDGMDAVLNLTPAGQTGTPDWGQTRTGFIVGDSVTIGETTTIDPQLFPGCVLTDSTIAGPGVTGTPALPAEGRAVTLATASSTYTVTNTVECQQLTIVKEVENRFGGDATAADWNDGLFATLGSDLVFDSGQTKYVATGSYVLSEAAAAGYQQQSLDCTGGTLTGDAVTIPAGADVTCTFVNEDIAGQVSWTKTDGTSALEGSEWSLTGPGADSAEVADCVGADVAACDGMLDQDPAAGAFLLKDLDWGDYTLVETAAPLGYVLDATPHTFTVDATTAGSVIALGAIVNTIGVAPALPLTGGIGADFYLFFGFGLLLLALLLLATRLLWVRSQTAVRTR